MNLFTKAVAIFATVATLAFAGADRAHAAEGTIGQYEPASAFCKVDGNGRAIEIPVPKMTSSRHPLGLQWVGFTAQLLRWETGAWRVYSTHQWVVGYVNSHTAYTPNPAIPIIRFQELPEGYYAVAAYYAWTSYRWTGAAQWGSGASGSHGEIANRHVSAGNGVGGAYCRLFGTGTGNVVVLP